MLELSGIYGDLDGENNYNYATVIAKVYNSLSADQKAKMVALRKSIMSGTYADGTPFDFTVCSTPYLYSDVIKDTSVLAPYLSNTDYLFGVSSGSFTLTSSVGTEGGTLPIDYTADGSGASPALSWSNAPAGTTGFAMLMTTLPGDGTTKWNWVLYSIPATASSLAKNNTTVGTTGMNSDTGKAVYAPPQSQGPGTQPYTHTIYAPSGTPSLPSSAEQVTGDVLTAAIASLTLGTATLNLSYARQAPVAAFTYAQGASTKQIVFTNASGLSATSWTWDFGDGSTSTETSPTHTYAADGSYTVKLTVGNTFGTASASKTVTVGGSSTTYALTVVSGTGSGSYAAGVSVSIQATPPATGKKFDKWTATAGTITSATESKTTFTMPAAAATVTASYKDIPTVTYALTVVNGSGSGEYAAGTTVDIVAYYPTEGMVFDRWSASVGKFGNGFSASTTFTMPAAAVTVTAAYKSGSSATFALIVVNGTGSGEYGAGETVAITADDPPSGMIFNAWAGATVDNPAATATTLVMPAAATTVTATYRVIVPATYTLTVVNGSGGGEYEAGAEIRVIANAAATGMQFSCWSGSDAIVDSESEETTILMPAEGTTVTAVYTQIGVTPKVAFSSTRTRAATGFKNSYTITATLAYPVAMTPNPLNFMGADTDLTMEFGGWSFSGNVSDAAKQKIGARSGTATFTTEAGDTVSLRWSARMITATVRSKQVVNGTTNILDLSDHALGKATDTLEGCSMSFGDAAWSGTIPWSGTVRTLKSNIYWSVKGKTSQ